MDSLDHCLSYCRLLETMVSHVHLYSHVSLCLQLSITFIHFVLDIHPRSLINLSRYLLSRLGTSVDSTPLGSHANTGVSQPTEFRRSDIGLQIKHFSKFTYGKILFFFLASSSPWHIMQCCDILTSNVRSDATRLSIMIFFNFLPSHSNFLRMYHRRLRGDRVAKIHRPAGRSHHSLLPFRPTAD